MFNAHVQGSLFNAHVHAYVHVLVITIMLMFFVVMSPFTFVLLLVFATCRECFPAPNVVSSLNIAVSAHVQPAQLAADEISCENEKLVATLTFVVHRTTITSSSDTVLYPLDIGAQYGGLPDRTTTFGMSFYPAFAGVTCKDGSQVELMSGSCMAYPVPDRCTLS